MTSTPDQSSAVGDHIVDATDMVLQHGDVLAVGQDLRWYDPRTWPAARIQALAGPPSHVEIVTRVYPLRTVGALVLRGVVEHNPLIAYASDRFRLSWHRPPACCLWSELRAAQEAQSLIGNGYDLSTIWRIRWSILRGVDALADAALTPWEADDEQICSELVAWAWYRAGAPLGVSRRPTPADVVAACRPLV